MGHDRKKVCFQPSLHVKTKLKWFSQRKGNGSDQLCNMQCMLVLAGCIVAEVPDKKLFSLQARKEKISHDE